MTKSHYSKWPIHYSIYQLNSLRQDCSNSSALAMESLQFCAKPSNWAEKDNHNPNWICNDFIGPGEPLKVRVCQNSNSYFKVWWSYDNFIFIMYIPMPGNVVSILRWWPGPLFDRCRNTSRQIRSALSHPYEGIHLCCGNSNVGY